MGNILHIWVGSRLVAGRKRYAIDCLSINGRRFLGQ
jgi:hypothetical protein